jgi:hypothetical protein
MLAVATDSISREEVEGYHYAKSSVLCPGWEYVSLSNQLTDPCSVGVAARRRRAAASAAAAPMLVLLVTMAMRAVCVQTAHTG